LAQLDLSLSAEHHLLLDDEEELDELEDEHGFTVIWLFPVNAKASGDNAYWQTTLNWTGKLPVYVWMCGIPMLAE
jgi:hypothetical protein